MRTEVANYYGIVAGIACLCGHLIIGFYKSRAPPSFLRLGMSFLSGMGVAPVLQLAPLVVAPPPDDARVPPAMIRVDDHRTTLALGLFAIIALCLLGLRDNWQAAQQADPKLASDGKPPTGA